jgi:hypothetical protein
LLGGFIYRFFEEGKVDVVGTKESLKGTKASSAKA